MNEAVRSIHRQIAISRVGPGVFDKLQTQKLAVVRDRKLSECRTAAARDRDKLSTQARADYSDRAEQERDQESLMMILTTSKPH
jgi:hypothetical protein